MPSPAPTATKQDILERTRAMTPAFAERAAAAEEARRIPQESVNDMLDAGFARVLVPREAGGSISSARTTFRLDASVASGPWRS